MLVGYCGWVLSLRCCVLCLPACLMTPRPFPDSSLRRLAEGSPSGVLLNGYASLPGQSCRLFGDAELSTEMETCPTASFLTVTL